MKIVEATRIVQNSVIGKLSYPTQSASVAMLHAGRSGSTVVGDLLNQHGEIFWDSEIFQNDRMHPLPGKVIRQLKKHPNVIIKLRRARTEKPIYGFETKFDHLDHLKMGIQSYIEQLRQAQFNYFIVLERKNYLRRIVSHFVGLANNRWHQKKDEKGKITQVKIDVETLCLGLHCQSLLAHLQDHDLMLAETKRLLHHDHLLWLTYEDDVMHNPKDAYQKICEFLGVKHNPVDVRYRRTNPYALSDIILNFEDVQKVLRHTPYAWMMD